MSDTYASLEDLRKMNGRPHTKYFDAGDGMVGVWDRGRVAWFLWKPNVGYVIAGTTSSPGRAQPKRFDT